MCDEQGENTQNECGYTHEQYLEDRKTYLNGYQDQQTLFDKTIITLSAGAVGLIFTVTKGQIDHWSLKVSVIAFILAVVSTTISFFCAANAYQSFLEQFETNYGNGDVYKRLQSKWSVWVNTTNYTSIILSITGVLFLMWYFLRLRITT